MRRRWLLVSLAALGLLAARGVEVARCEAALIGGPYQLSGVPELRRDCSRFLGVVPWSPPYSAWVEQVYVLPATRAEVDTLRARWTRELEGRGLRRLPAASRTPDVLSALFVTRSGQSVTLLFLRRGTGEWRVVVSAPR